jgi:hypothetical protein
VFAAFASHRARCSATAALLLHDRCGGAGVRVRIGIAGERSSASPATRSSNGSDSAIGCAPADEPHPLLQ